MKTDSQPQPIVICAQQRSGTTVLHQTLGKSPLLTNFGEVFHEKIDAFPVRFFTFKMELMKREPQLCFPTHENQREIFDHFLSYLRHNCQTPFYIADIKYNSWHHFDTTWQGQLNMPFLLLMLREQNARVIHVVRNNVFQQRVSIDFARETQQWHVAKGKQVTEREIRIDPRGCQKDMELSRQRSELFRGWFTGYSNYVELAYEEMFIDGQFSPETRGEISRLIGGRFQMQADPALRKGLKNVSNVISNRDELLRHFEGTQFEEMVHASLHAA